MNMRNMSMRSWILYRLQAQIQANTRIQGDRWFEGQGRDRWK